MIDFAALHVDCGNYTDEEGSTDLIGCRNKERRERSEAHEKIPFSSE